MRRGPLIGILQFRDGCADALLAERIRRYGSGESLTNVFYYTPGNRKFYFRRARLLQDRTILATPHEKSFRGNILEVEEPFLLYSISQEVFRRILRKEQNPSLQEHRELERIVREATDLGLDTYRLFNAQSKFRVFTPGCVYFSREGIIRR